MSEKREHFLPLGGSLLEALEIERPEPVENPSLQMKLHDELARDGGLRREAASPERIGKLKAAGMRGGRSLCGLH